MVHDVMDVILSEAEVVKGGGGGPSKSGFHKRFQMRNLGCPILTAKVNQQHPPAHHVGWMWFGQETLFHY
jgi:hypothetical protein